MASIDNLVVQITANTSSAAQSLDNLNRKLNQLNITLNSLNFNVFNNLSQGVNNLANAMTTFKNSGIGKADFTRLASSLNQLALVNIQGIYRLGNALGNLARNFGVLANVNAVSQQVVTLVNALSRFGYASITRAIANIPLLTTALVNMINALSKAPAVSQNIINLINAIANLVAQGQRLGNAGKTINTAFQNIYNGSRRARNGINSIASAIGKFYATYLLLIRGVKGLWKNIQDSMDYVETFNYFNVSMQKIGQDTANRFGEFGKEAAEKYSDNFITQMKDLNRKMTGYAVGSSGELVWADADNLGLDPNQLMNFQARIGAVTNSVGLFGEVSTNTAEALSMLSSDLSSLTNVDTADVMQNLSSALIGQSRAVYKYGIDITNAKLSEYALANGITKRVSAMSQAEKMMLRTIAILDQSEVAWGDQANTINSVANQYRLLKQALSNLARILGNLVLPIVKVALPVINGLILALSRLAESIGFQLYGDNWLTDLMDGISNAIGSADDLGDAFEDDEGDIDNVGNAAKKLKKQLQGFDELNIISQDDKDALELLVEDNGKLNDALSKSLEKYRKAWNEAFGNIKNDATKFSQKIEIALKPVGEIFSSLINGDFELAGEQLSDLAIGFFNMISEALKKVDWKEVGSNIIDFIAGIKWGELISSIGNFIEIMFNSALDLWKGAWEENPIATFLVSSLALAKFTGLTDVLIAKILSAFPSTLSVGKTIVLSAITFTVGMDVGKAIGKALFPKDKAYYENFHIFGEDGLLQTIFETDVEILIDAIKNALGDLNEKIVDVIKGVFHVKTKIKEPDVDISDWYNGIKDKMPSKSESAKIDPSYHFDTSNTARFSSATNFADLVENAKVEVSMSSTEQKLTEEQLAEAKTTNDLLRQQRNVNVSISSNELYNSVRASAWNRFNATGSTGLP